MKETKDLLLVDDTELFLAMEKSFLQRREFVLHTARSGKEALQLARDIEPDLILLDLHMPDMNGAQVCAALKEDPRFERVPIVIATSEKNKATLAKCIDARCDAILLKPFNKETLVRTILEILVISQRQFKRADVEISCTVRIDKEKLPSTIRNISESGAFIDIRIPLEKGSILDLDFKLPDTDYMISTQVIVRWASSFTRIRAQAGMGVEFLTVSQVERDLIRILIDQQHKKWMRKMIGMEEEK